MKLISNTPSPNPNKKWRATFQLDNGKTKYTDYGSAGMDDYTITKDKEQRERYRARHMKDLKTNDPTRAGYLAFYILWGDSTNLATNITAYKRRFNL
jgi:hypothetical protein